MQRVRLTLAAVAAALVVPATAGAYPIPSGLSGSAGGTSSCLPYVNDGSAATGAVNTLEVPGSNVNANGGLFTSASAPGSGGATFVEVDSAGGQPLQFSLQLQDSGGSWHTVGGASIPSGQYEGTLSLPATWPGAVRVLVWNWGTTSAWINAHVTSGQTTADGKLLADELSVDCYNRQANAAANHSDLASIDTDVGNVKSAVAALQGSGSNTSTLYQLHTDLQQLDADVKANAPTSGSGSTQPVSLTGPVQLSSGDRQLSADVAGQIDGDLWIIVGVVVGCFAAGEILKRTFPAGGGS
jgi:hypothetical protein